MIRLTIRSVIIYFFISTLQLQAQNSYLDKEVFLQTGQMSLKEVLKLLSNQTACVFSYDPISIVDKKKVNITSNAKMSLGLALIKVLPKNTEFKSNNKYIVLKKKSHKSIQKIDNPNDISVHQFSPNQKKETKIETSATVETSIMPTKDTISVFAYTTNDAKFSVPDNINANGAETNSGLNDTNAKAQLTAPQDTINPTSRSEILVFTKSQLDFDKTTDSLYIDNYDNSNSLFRKNGYCEVGVSFNRKLGSVSFRSGLYNLYSILTLAADYHQSYSYGVGAGIRVKFNRQLSVDFDLLRNTLFAGKSYLLKVRASNTQFYPALNYFIGKNLQISGGPIIHLIKSRYENSESTTNLGTLVAVGLSLGIKIDLIGAFIPNS